MSGIHSVFFHLAVDHAIALVRHVFSKIIFLILSKNKIISFLGYQYAMISMKVVLAGILRKYQFTTSLKLSDLEMKFELTLKLTNKHMVGMERRIW